jgi:hypothetical protein
MIPGINMTTRAQAKAINIPVEYSPSCTGGFFDDTVAVGIAKESG